MIELAAAVSGACFYDCGKMVRFVTPHRPDDRDVIDYAADMRKPIGDRRSAPTVTCELALTGDNWPAHFGKIVAKADHVDELAGPLIILGVERVNVADSATHEQKDDRLCFGGRV